MKAEKAEIRISGYNYPLPEEKIAAFPLPQRDSSKLLVYKSGKIEDDFFYNLPGHLPQGATLVANNTKVIAARILFQKSTGGVIEIFCLEPAGGPMEQALAQKGMAAWNCLVGGASKWKPGQILKKELSSGAILSVRYGAKVAGHFVIQFSWEPSHLSFAELLHEAGAMPLPPYIKREAQTEDEDRYQTVFARHQGSVAAPTAALHFTPQTFAALAQKKIETAYITLHVGAGTFKPVKAETIGGHEMHAEHFQVSAQTLQALINADQIVAVGTTSLRSLESLYWIGIKLLRNALVNEDELNLGQWEAYDLEAQAAGISYKESLQALLDHLQQKNQPLLFCNTALLIVPGYGFRSAMALVTNFHQPQSTLLLLVAAFIGEDWHNVYAHALQHGYRFLSYGDSSLLFRKKQ